MKKMSLTVKNIIQTLRTSLDYQQFRYYSPRWNHRQPIAVYTPEEYEKIEQNQRIEGGDTIEDATIKKNKHKTNNDEPSTKIHWKYTENNRTNMPPKTTNNFNAKQPLIASKQVTHRSGKGKDFPKQRPTDMFETVIQKDGSLVYTKMHNNDKRVGSILTCVKSSREKDRNNLMLLEGKRLISQALQAKCALKYLLFSRVEDVEVLKPLLPKLGASLYKMPYREMQMWSDLTTNPGIMGLFSIPTSENYTKPSGVNVGLTVICDNIREPGNLGGILRVCAGAGVHRVLLTKGCVNLWDTKVLRSSMGAQFSLQMEGNLEWDAIAAKLGSEITSFGDGASADGGDLKIFIADNKRVFSHTTSSNLGEVLRNIPTLPYFSVNYGQLRNIVLVVGGETMGLSEDCYKFAAEHNGIRINIPLCEEIESLNVSTALGVIVFEMKRQLVEKSKS